MKNLIIILILALFFVQCGKKKDNGLGLGILLLAGGSSSSSSSDNATNSVNPKQPGGGGNGGDDPNNAPEFDEVKQEIEKNITFPAGNENKILSSNSDYQSVDFSIMGDFFQELGKLEKLSLEHSVSAGSKKIDPTKIDISKQMITDEKIPLTLDLSSLQPENGFAQPKLKLKFSSNDKQIIQKEWTQKLFLQGKKQIPSLSYTNKSNEEINFTETVIYDSFNDPVPVQVSIPDNLGLSDQFETRIEAISLNWSSGAHNNTWSPTLTAPNQAAAAQPSKNLSLKLGNSVTLASQLFYRLKGNNPWIDTPNFTNYYLTLDNTDDFQIEINSLLLKKGKKLTLSLVIPSGYTNSRVQNFTLDFFTPPTTFVPVYRITKDGVLQENNSPDGVRLKNKYISSFTYDDPNKPIQEKQKYTMSLNFKDNLKENLTLKFKITSVKDGSGLANAEKSFNIRLNTDTN